jgi:5'-nucleotidase
MVKRTIAAAAVAALGAAPAPAGTGARAHGADAPVDVQLLAVNDFHGNLEPPDDTGGAAYLATHLRRAAARNPRTLLVSAGDLIGASPLVSGLQHDDPTIEAFNRLGLDANAVGNHELDEGLDELRRIGREARFPLLSANVVDAETREPVFSPSVVRRVGGVRVGLIGATVRGTPDIAARAATAGLAFADEADAINAAARDLRRRGVRAIVVLLHQGGHDCQDAPDTPLRDIVRRTTRDVDLFVTGHTHDDYVCVVDGRPVTSAGSYGRMWTAIDLTLDGRTGEVQRVRAANHEVSHDVARAPDLQALVDRSRALSAPTGQRVLGRLAAGASRGQAPSGESAAGDLLADAQLAATRDAGAVAAFTNAGGLRESFRGGLVRFEDAYDAQPFGRRVVTATYSGAQLRAALRQQWCGQEDANVLSVSAGVRYRYDPAVAAAMVGKPCDGAPDPVADLAIGGEPVRDDGTYRISLSDYLADGRDWLYALGDGRDRVTGPQEVDAFAALLAPSVDGPTLTVPSPDRITVG